MWRVYYFLSARLFARGCNLNLKTSSLVVGCFFLTQMPPQKWVHKRINLYCHTPLRPPTSDLPLSPVCPCPTAHALQAHFQPRNV